MWFIGVEVEQETSAPPPPPLKNILDPPLRIQCILELADLGTTVLLKKNRHERVTDN